MFAPLAVCRFLHYGAAMTVFGASLYLALAAPPTLSRELARRFRWPLGLLVALLGLTTLAWWALEGGAMGEGWSDVFDGAILSATLTETQFGAVWQYELGFVAALGLALAWRGGAGVAARAALAGGALVALGFIGHATMATGPLGWASRGVLALHLVAAGVWIGGLAPLAMALRRLGGPERRGEALAALLGFSRLAVGAAAATLLTGIANVALTLGPTRPDPASPYQAALAVKIAVVAAMLALALVNRYALTPRLARGETAAARAIARNADLELLLAGCATALVAAFGLLPPA